MSKLVEIVYVDPGGSGYHPLFYMARLAAELFEAELIVLPSRSLTIAERFLLLLPRKRRGLNCVLICPQPANLFSISLVKGWRDRYGCVVAWVFDSFWLDYVSRFSRFSSVFDRVYVAEQDDLDVWRGKLRAPVEWLPWGSDVFRLGSANPERPIDLLRFGRQPMQWDDDISNMRICESMQLRFQGRPPHFHDASEGQRALMHTLGQTKFTLSFSNRVSPSVQTHPKREYITGRWTDALSAGATVAGVPPQSESVKALLWERALLDLGTVDRMEGLAVLASAIRNWTPCCAKRNYLRSLEVLDWRWRFERLALTIGVQPPTLDSELKRLRQTIAFYR